MAVSTKASGNMIFDMEKVLKGIQMEIRTLDNLSTEELMEKEFIPGKTERCMMVNGIKA